VWQKRAYLLANDSNIRIVRSQLCEAKKKNSLSQKREKKEGLSRPKEDKGDRAEEKASKLSAQARERQAQQPIDEKTRKKKVGRGRKGGGTEGH